VLMVLVEHEAVKAELLGIDQLIDVFLIEAGGALTIPQRVRNRHPAAVVALIEVRRQVGIGHEMPAEQLHRSHLVLPRTRASVAALPCRRSTAPGALRHRPRARQTGAMRNWG